MKDNINHPEHYKTDNGLETIDVIEAFTEGLQGGEATSTGNILKYICRWKKKNGLEDLKKAQWYLNRLIDLVQSRQEKEMLLADSTSSRSTAAAYNENKDGRFY